MKEKLWEASSSQKKIFFYQIMNNLFQKNLKKILIKNMDIPNKGTIYPIVILLLIIFGYLNSRRKE